MMKNKYASICYRCKQKVIAGDGCYTRTTTGEWQVHHATACIFYRRKKLIRIKTDNVIPRKKWYSTEYLEDLNWLIQNEKTKL